MKNLVLLSFLITIPLSIANTVHFEETVYDESAVYRQFITEDFDLDGTLDLGVTDSSGSIKIYINDGSGGFLSPLSFTTELDSKGITSGYFNGDSFVDVAVTNTLSNTLTIYFGNGDGTFYSKTTYSSVIMHPFSISAGDLNGDNSDEIVFVSEDVCDSVVIFENDGVGNFSFHSVLSVNQNPDQIEILDADLDGYNDIIVGHSGFEIIDHYVWLFKGNNDLTFEPPSYEYDLFDHWGGLLNNYHVQFKFKDINEDGISDYFLSTSSFKGEIDNVILAACIRDSNNVLDALYSDITFIFKCDFIDLSSSLNRVKPISLIYKDHSQYFIFSTDSTNSVDYDVIYELYNYHYSETKDINNDGCDEIILSGDGIKVLSKININSCCCDGIRGNVDDDPYDVITISDLVTFVNYSFGVEEIDYYNFCSEEADINGDNTLDIQDIVNLVSFMFDNGATPSACP